MYEFKQGRFQQTLKAIESIASDKTVDAHHVHLWLNSRGTKNELNPPTADKQICS